MTNISNKYAISIAADQVEAEEFADWLRDQGHDVEIGDSTGNYIDSRWTSSDVEADEIMSRFWSAYCNR